MLLIPCPHCGPRDEIEFVYGGNAITFPAMGRFTDMGKMGSLKDWHEVIHMRENSAGLLAELWYHDAGCECWIEVARNTLTHAITEARPSGDIKSMHRPDAN